MTDNSLELHYLGAEANVSPYLGKRGGKVDAHDSCYSDAVLNCGGTNVQSIATKVNLGAQYGQSIKNCGAVGQDIHAASEHNGQDQQPSVDYNPYEIPHGSGLLKHEP